MDTLPDDDGLLLRALKPSEMQGVWLVAHVEGGQERKIAKELSAARRTWATDAWMAGDIGVYLPDEQVKVTDLRGKKRLKRRLLFPTYIFACVRDELDERYFLSSRQKLIKTLQVVDQAGMSKYLDDLHTCLGSGVYLEHHPQITDGRKCRVMRGRLRGIEGFVLNRGKRGKVVIQLKEFMGGGVMLDVDIDDLEAID